MEFQSHLEQMTERICRWNEPSAIRVMA